MNQTRFGKLVSVLLIAVFASASFVTPAQAAGNTIVDVALAANASTGEFSILIAALQAANQDVLKKLSSKGEYTVFAPTDAAFTALLAELGLTAEQLLADRALVTRVLRYHIIRDDLSSAEVLSKQRIRTWQGGFLAQANGVLTDAQCRTANIVQTDIQASNGFIHVIDRVVLPGSGDDDDWKRICNSIVDVATSANAATGEFSILISALQAANPFIIESLSSKGQYTVFAPTDAAFLALLDELGVTAEQLLADGALVTKVLRYHIVPDNLDSSEVLAKSRIHTWQGTVFQANGVLTDANGRTANIVQTDIQASNGVIHVIDRVILPNLNAPPGDDDDHDD